MIRKYKIIIYCEFQRDSNVECAEAAIILGRELLDYADAIKETKTIDCELEEKELREQHRLFGQNQLP